MSLGTIRSLPGVVRTILVAFPRFVDRFKQISHHAMLQCPLLNSLVIGKKICYVVVRFVKTNPLGWPTRFANHHLALRIDVCNCRLNLLKSLTHLIHTVRRGGTVHAWIKIALDKITILDEGFQFVVKMAVRIGNFSKSMRAHTHLNI